MTPYGIVYKDTVPSVNESAAIWQKKSGMISNKYFILSVILATASILAVNGLILLLKQDKDIYLTDTLLITVMEAVSVIFLLKSSLKRNMKKFFSTTSSDKILKQAVLREYDVEFSTPYSKSNYFYDEIAGVIEGVNSLSIIIEEGNLPICISKSGVVKGETEKFISLFKEKMQGRYRYENATGGKM
ncbi:MAG: hypothetical protein IKV21_03365 [Clostridia bacterium]|nr:hypothetical protein [Clostridia bacterium]